jgi:hypothetical protein
MFFDRKREIQAISQYLLNGDSVLVIGERRIGKTFLLYMLGSHARRNANLYDQMLDQDTAALLAGFHNATASSRWLFVNLSGASTAAGFYFDILTKLAGEQENRIEQYKTLFPMDHAMFVSEVMSLSDDLCREKKRAIVLVDESEKLIELDGGEDVFSCLKAAIQQCDHVNFVLAGDFKPHQETAQFRNLRGVLGAVHLGPLDSAGARGLIALPVSGWLSFEDATLQRILELTGGKPGLVQVLCDHLCACVSSGHAASRHIQVADFDQLWESFLRDRVFESFDAPLREYFDGLRGHEQEIFAFLAHHPMATADAIATVLEVSLPLVERSLYLLRTTHRVKTSENRSCISAQVVQEFGSRFIPHPMHAAELTFSRSSAFTELLGGEHATLEYKASMRWDYRAKQVSKALEKVIAKTVAGFLNSEGGTLLIGVADDCTVKGIEQDLKTLKKGDKDGYEQKLREILNNALGVEFAPYQHVSFEEHEGKVICVVQVEPCRTPVYLTDKGSKEFYIRAGNTTQPLDMQAAHKYISMRWPVRSMSR